MLETDIDDIDNEYMLITKNLIMIAITMVIKIMKIIVLTVMILMIISLVITMITI